MRPARFQIQRLQVSARAERFQSAEGGADEGPGVGGGDVGVEEGVDVGGEDVECGAEVGGAGGEDVEWFGGG